MILDRFQMKDRVAIVTGAGRGIGAGIATAFSEVGAHVVCSARTQSQIDEVAQTVRSNGSRALAVQCDVTEREQLENLVEATMKEFGRIDVVVNNAGGTPPKPILRTSEKMFEDAFRFNATSAFLLSRFAIPPMLETAGGGSIVNISSAMGRFTDRGFVAYGTAKAALAHMTRLMGVELAPRIRVNGIAVGSVETSALGPFVEDRERREQMENLTPLRRLGTTEDIAICATYLASDAGSFVTGKMFEIDGGIEASNFPFQIPDL
ncbi:MAG: SDR family oxidoreductase [bacterium]|nr:SDR family oxidoreductase [bacterium]